MKKFFLAQIDKLGLLATSLCALHCLIFPLLLPALPFFGLSSWSESANHELIDTITITTSIGLGFLALLSGYRKNHKKLTPFYTLGVAVLVYAQRHTFGEPNEPYVIILGSMVMLYAHYQNIRLSREFSSCKAGTESGCQQQDATDPVKQA